MVLMLCLLLLVLGLYFLYKGGDIFTESCIFFSEMLPFSPIITGATIVSLANAVPDFLVSIRATIKGHHDIAIGNCLGAIICNIGLVIGVAGIMYPTHVKSRYLNIKAIIMLLCGGILYIVSRDRIISHYDSLILIGALLIYVIISCCAISIKSQKNKNIMRTRISKIDDVLLKNVGGFLFGLLLISIGAGLILKYAIELSTILGFPRRTIAISIIAFGASLPELTTTLIASKKGYYSIAVGNIIGTNILNILLVIGISSAFRPLTVDKMMFNIDMPFLLILMSFFVLFTIGYKEITKLRAGLLLTLYLVYTILLWLAL